tara:strand:- start:78 stop:377 length:300 start_codon:yes stop_codon:yes gene_type:complete
LEEGALGVCAVALAPSLLHSIKFELSVVPILVGSNILGKLQKEKKEMCQKILYNKTTTKNKRTKKNKKEQEQEQRIHTLPMFYDNHDLNFLNQHSILII